MKDLPHHMKKLNRRIVRSEHRLIESELESMEEANVPMQTINIERPKEQIRKQIKSRMRKETESHIPEHFTPEEKNRKMKHRVPIFDRTSHPRHPIEGALAKKSTPRISPPRRVKEGARAKKKAPRI